MFDEIDYQRAVQVYLWGYTAVSIESIRLAAIPNLGADFHDVLIAEKFADRRPLADGERLDDLRLDERHLGKSGLS